MAPSLAPARPAALESLPWAIGLANPQEPRGGLGYRPCGGRAGSQVRVIAGQLSGQVTLLFAWELLRQSSGSPTSLQQG